MNGTITTMNMPYNPEQFEKDKRYLEGLHVEDVKEFISKRYSRNKEHIKDIISFLVEDFVRGGSNVYRNAPTYKDWEDESWVERRRVALYNTEKYGLLNIQALQWTYKDNNEWMFRSLQASDFIIIYNKSGETDNVIIRTGQFISSENNQDIMYHFKMWRESDKMVYKCTADSWSSLPDINQTFEENDINTAWVKDPDQPKYKYLPFTLLGNNLAMPILSTLTTLENIISGGAAFGDIAAQRAFLDMIYGVTGLKAGDWAKLMTDIGLMKMPNIPSKEGGSNAVQPTLNNLKLGDGKVQNDWFDFMIKTLKMVAHAKGVDTIGMFGELKVESGAARRLMLQPVAIVRNERINTFMDFERRDQQLLINLGVVSNFSEIEFAALDMGETENEKEETETKRIANIKERFTIGTITRIEMISEIERISIEEAELKNKEVIKESSGGEENETNQEASEKEDSANNEEEEGAIN